MDRSQNNKEQTEQQQQNTQQATQKPKKDIQISAATKDKAEAAKAYIERKYAKAIQEERKSKENWDTLQKKMEELNFSQAEQELIKRDIIYKDAELSRKKRQKTKAEDFQPLHIIGRGAFGEVRICRLKEDNKIFAVKKMKKHEMLSKHQIGHIRAERDVLAQFDNLWIVELFCSFQDDKYLYLVMEFLAGGDLMTVLMKKDILSEEESKFYISELILAVDSIHKMNYIHRDLKPDNILIDKDGHIKISDFGLCKHTEIKPKIDFGKTKIQESVLNNPGLILTKKPPQKYVRNRQLAFSTVGTPDYIAPEVFGQQGYTETVDWWSIGVILFEMLVGYPPFFSDDPSQTCQKILHWKKTFQIPAEANLSQSSADLIKRLIADQTERLGINGVEEIKAHPFFVGVDWKKIRDKKAPYVPPVTSETDVQNFDQFKEETPWIDDDTTKKRNRKLDINFAGYSFKRELEQERPQLVSALENLEQTRQSSPRYVNRQCSPRPVLRTSDHQNNQQQQQQQQFAQQQVLNMNNGNLKNNMGLSSTGNTQRENKNMQQQVNQYQYNQMKASSPGRQQSPNSLQNQYKIGNAYFLQQLQKNNFAYDPLKGQQSPKGQVNNVLGNTQQQNTNINQQTGNNNNINVINTNAYKMPQKSTNNQNNNSSGSFKKVTNVQNVIGNQNGSPRGYDQKNNGINNVMQNNQANNNIKGGVQQYNVNNNQVNFRSQSPNHFNYK